MHSGVGTAAGECLETLKSEGFNFFTGVADSLVASLIQELTRDPVGYVPAVREDAAVGLAAGAYLAGRWPAVLMQNSGLGYCLNALMSLNLIYRIPILLMVGYRGFQGKDAPEHSMMGRHCEALVREIGIPIQVPEASSLSAALAEASRFMRRKNLPAAVFIKPGILG